MSLYSTALSVARTMLPPDGHSYYVYRTVDPLGPATLIRALSVRVGCGTADCERRAARAIHAALVERGARSFGAMGEVYLGRDGGRKL